VDHFVDIPKAEIGAVMGNRSSTRGSASVTFEAKAAS
jgi:hypothetical protein